jgi:hypothetical protein
VQKRSEAHHKGREQSGPSNVASPCLSRADRSGGTGFWGTRSGDQGSRAARRSGWKGPINPIRLATLTFCTFRYHLQHRFIDVHHKATTTIMTVCILAAARAGYTSSITTTRWLPQELSSRRRGKAALGAEGVSRPLHLSVGRLLSATCFEGA